MSGSYIEAWNDIIPLPARLIHGVFPFVNKPLSAVKKKKKNPRRTWLFARLALYCIWHYVILKRVALLQLVILFEWPCQGGVTLWVCPRGKKGAKTPHQFMFFFRSDDKMWKWPALKITKRKPGSLNHSWVKMVNPGFKFESLKESQSYSFGLKFDDWMLQKLVEKIIRENAFEQKKEFRINRPSKNWTQIIFFYFICHINIV